MAKVFQISPNMGKTSLPAAPPERPPIEMDPVAILGYVRPRPYDTRWPSVQPVRPTRHAHPNLVLVNSYWLGMPSNQDMQGVDLAKIVQNQETMFRDYLETGIIRPSDLGDDPWSYRHRVGNRLRAEELEAGTDIDPTLLQISEKEVKFMGSTLKVVLNAVWNTLETVGIPPSLLHKTRTGVFVAATKNFGGFLSYPDETSLRSGLQSGHVLEHYSLAVSAGTIIKEMGYVALFTRSRTPHYLAYPRATRSLVVQAVGSHSIFSRHARTDVDGRDGMLVEPRCSDLGGECHTRRIVRCCYRPCRQRSDQRV